MATQAAYVTSIDDVDTYARDNGRPEWLALSNDEKVRSIVEATEDIIMYHKQIPVDNSLWLSTEPKLITANIVQAIYIGKTKGLRDLGQNARAASDGNYSDGMMNIVGGTRKLTKYAKFLVNEVVMDALEYGTFSLEREYRDDKFVRS